MDELLSWLGISRNLFSWSRYIYISELSHSWSSQMVVFAELEGKYHNFLNIKIWDCKLNVLQWNYCKDLVLGSLETKFLEIGVYVSLKRVTAVVWEDRNYRIWVKMQQFLYVKMGILDLKISLFNYLDILCYAEQNHIF